MPVHVLDAGNHGARPWAGLAAVRLGMVAGGGAVEAQSVGVGPEVGKLRLAVMDLNGSALRIQQTTGQVAQAGSHHRRAGHDHR